jgi:hypothetical protein
MFNMNGLRQQLALSHGYDNFCLPHASLRQPLPQPEPTNGHGSAKRWQSRTPGYVKGTYSIKSITIIYHLWYFFCMKFRELVDIVGDEPIFETGLLLVGNVDPVDVRRQLSRWAQAGRLYQLRRGLYALAPPFQKVKSHPFMIANRLVRSSYVSCQSALAHYQLIPEYVPVVTSVTTGRPGRWDTALGSFVFRHIKIDLLYDYRLTDLGGGQRALVATPEKALLDLIHLQTGGDAPSYLQELRLQNLDSLDVDALQQQAERANSPKLRRAAQCVMALARAEALEYETL